MLIWITNLPQFFDRKSIYLQGTVTCTFEITIVNTLDSFVPGMAGVFFTVKIVLYLRKMQRKFGIPMTKAKIFSIKLIAILCVLYISLISSYLAFIVTDPGFTFEITKNGYVDWRTCRYSQYLTSSAKGEDVDYSSCKSLEKLSVGRVELLVIMTGCVGALTCLILACKADYIIELLKKNKIIKPKTRDNENKKSSNSHEKVGIKPTGSQSNTTTTQIKATSVKKPIAPMIKKNLR